MTLPTHAQRATMRRMVAGATIWVNQNGKKGVTQVFLAEGGENQQISLRLFNTMLEKGYLEPLDEARSTFGLSLAGRDAMAAFKEYYKDVRQRRTAKWKQLKETVGQHDGSFSEVPPETADGGGSDSDLR